MTDLNLASVWEFVADDYGDRLALWHGDTKRTWSEFESRASLLAGALAEVGVGLGDNVARSTTATSISRPSSPP